jgi:hypothetical protein
MVPQPDINQSFNALLPANAEIQTRRTALVEGARFASFFLAQNDDN